jgi:hypothetical protein
LISCGDCVVGVLSLDLWSDERWPDLTLDAVVARHPEHSTAWRQVAGSVAVPGVWEGRRHRGGSRAP